MQIVIFGYNIYIKFTITVNTVRTLLVFAKFRVCFMMLGQGQRQKLRQLEHFYLWQIFCHFSCYICWELAFVFKIFTYNFN